MLAPHQPSPCRHQPRRNLVPGLDVNTISIDPPTSPAIVPSCPYLGVQQDRDTQCTFPTDAHRCHRSDRPVSITLEHQLRYCLDASHAGCPVYLKQVSNPPHDRWRLPSPLVLRASGLVLLAGSVVMTAAFWLSTDATPAPVAAGAGVSTATTVAESPPPTVPVQAATVAPAPVTAPPAPAMQRYIVRPGDTLTEIALFYGARMDDLISQNRLPADGTVLTGQELIIPRGP
jgi:LysM repeat protein